jgi:hypothetical protein
MAEGVATMSEQPIHDPLCDAGPDDNGWQPPCVKPHHVPAYESDYPSCSYCWDREDNCKCRCDLIREVRKDAARDLRQWIHENHPIIKGYSDIYVEGALMVVEGKQPN